MRSGDSVAKSSLHAEDHSFMSDTIHFQPSIVKKSRQWILKPSGIEYFCDTLHLPRRTSKNSIVYPEAADAAKR
uniref:Uncharacterized protein n=1 Tax=Romanomermis culicivorax TaxID=13658 RepID=A0A915JTX6_ROMCU